MRADLAMHVLWFRPDSFTSQKSRARLLAATTASGTGLSVPAKAPGHMCSDTLYVQARFSMVWNKKLATRVGISSVSTPGLCMPTSWSTVGPMFVTAMPSCTATPKRAQTAARLTCIDTGLLPLALWGSPGPLDPAGSLPPWGMGAISLARDRPPPSRLVTSQWSGEDGGPSGGAGLGDP